MSAPTAQPRVRSPRDVLCALDQLSAAVFAALDQMAAAVAQAGPSPARRDLAPLEQLVADVLGDDALPVAGAGYVAAADVLTDAPYWLEWWSAAGGGRGAGRLSVQTDPDAEDFRDYTMLPWFAGPRADRARHVTGPYVDYLCTDEYTLTYTVPVQAGARFLGVVGADVRVREVERLLAPALAALPAPATLTTATGRVVTSCGGPCVTGDLVREVPGWWQGGRLPPGWSLHRCAEVPFGLLVHADLERPAQRSG